MIIIMPILYFIDYLFDFGKLAIILLLLDTNLLLVLVVSYYY